MPSSRWQGGESSASAARSAAFRSAIMISSPIAELSATGPALASTAPAGVTTRRHSRRVVAASHPASATGSGSFPRCSTSSSHTFCATSSRSRSLSRKLVQIDHTIGAYRSTISSHAPWSPAAARAGIVAAAASSCPARPGRLALSPMSASTVPVPPFSRRSTLSCYLIHHGAGKSLLPAPQPPRRRIRSLRYGDGVVSIEGDVAPGFERVRDVFGDNFESNGDVGAALCVYRNGRKVVDLWGGLADAGTGRPWTRDTLQLVYSATKAATARSEERRVGKECRSR